MSWVKQVHLTTLQTIRHPKKRRSTAELGCFASRSRLVLNVLYVAIKVSYGAKGDCLKREEMFAPFVVI